MGKPPVPEEIQEIIRYLARDINYSGIAKVLGISVLTVKKYAGAYEVRPKKDIR